MKGLQLLSTGGALPGRVVTNEDLCRQVDTDDAWITTRTGIRQRYYCTESEDAATMAIAAARQALERSGLAPGDIACCVAATLSSPTLTPGIACRVQAALHLPVTCPAFEEEHTRGQQRGFEKVSPYFVPMSIGNMAAGQVAIRFGLQGLCSCPTTVCAGGTNAIGDAFHRIRDEPFGAFSAAPGHARGADSGSTRPNRCCGGVKPAGKPRQARPVRRHQKCPLSSSGPARRCIDAGM